MPLFARVRSAVFLASISLVSSVGALAACRFEPDASGNQSAQCMNQLNFDCTRFERASTVGTYRSGEDLLPAELRIAEARACGTLESDGGLLVYYLTERPVQTMEHHHAALESAGVTVTPLSGTCGRAFDLTRGDGNGNVSTLEDTGVIYAAWTPATR